MALPKAVAQRTSTSASRVLRATDDSANAAIHVDSISKDNRDRVLIAILDSIILNPFQTKAERVEETLRIAQELNERKFAVAGVRAALARGTYGDATKLIRNRKAQLRRLQVKQAGI